MSEDKDTFERELKFPGVDHNELRARLVELEAERLAPSSFEDNLIFDRDGELDKRGSLLRLRSDRQGAHLTFKGPARYEGKMKVREEIETSVDDAEHARSLLEGLGFDVVKRYQKQREEWRLGGVTVALDKTPIGDFAEFEGEGAEKLARRCSLDPDQAERRSYIRLYEEHRLENPEAPDEMVFP